jgi:hypothetical protein
MYRMSNCPLDLLQRDGKRFGRAVQEQPHPLASSAKLPHAIEQPLRVPHGRDVRIRHQKHAICGVECGYRDRVDLAARVHDDVVVLRREEPKHFFDRTGVSHTGSVELLRPGQDFQPRFVFRHQLAQELSVEAVEVVDRIEHAEARPDAQEETHLAKPRLEVDNERRPLAQAR